MKLTLILTTMKATSTIGKFVFLGSSIMTTVVTIAAVVFNPALMLVAAMFLLVTVSTRK